MKSGNPVLLPLMRSELQGEILTRIMLWPDEEFTIADLVRHTGASPATALREVNRIEEAGLARTRQAGRNRYVKAIVGNPVASAMQLLMEATYGPRPVLAEELATVPGIAQALIYGSWADRRAGNPGLVPNDIDLLVVGNPDRTALDEATDRAEKRLHREVNVRRISEDRWTSDDPFVRTVKSRPMIELGVRTDD